MDLADAAGVEVAAVIDRPHAIHPARLNALLAELVVAAVSRWEAGRQGEDMQAAPRVSLASGNVRKQPGTAWHSTTGARTQSGRTSCSRSCPRRSSSRTCRPHWPCSPPGTCRARAPRAKLDSRRIMACPHFLAVPRAQCGCPRHPAHVMHVPGVLPSHFRQPLPALHLRKEGDDARHGRGERERALWQLQPATRPAANLQRPLCSTLCGLT